MFILTALQRIGYARNNADRYINKTQGLDTTISKIADSISQRYVLSSLIVLITVALWLNNLSYPY
jgi:hypothetical protein